jgi:signal transduction histidine kinase
LLRRCFYISKIENRQYLKEETVPAKQLVTDVLSEMESRIESQNIRVIQQWNDDFEIKHANRSLLHTMLFNLVSNAVKYNKENGEIIITGRRENDRCELIIRDTGIGISGENIQHIFDRFKRFRPDDEVSYGLGLPIVRTIAEFHHLEIKVDSKLNEGTSFRILFPVTD